MSRLYASFFLFLCILGILTGCGPVKEELGRARSQFQTQLIKMQPSPGEYSYSFPPEGVRAAYYISDRLRLKAWISETKPLDPRQKQPAVIFVHGGFSFGLSDWEAAKPFVDTGFLLLAPMLRGENGNPGYFEFFYGELDDLLAAGAYLVNLQRVDKRKLFLVGYDTGATLALLCSMVTNPFHTIVAIGPYPDQNMYFKSYWRAAVPFDLDNALEVKLRSPLEYVSSINTHLFILVGHMDLTAKEQCLKFTQQACELHKPCETEIINGDHFSSLQKALARSVEICRARL